MNKKTKETYNYIVWQIIITSQKFDGEKNNVQLYTLIRQVMATSKEEAIGKFLLNTEQISAEKKLPIECLLLSEIRKI